MSSYSAFILTLKSTMKYSLRLLFRNWKHNPQSMQESSLRKEYAQKVKGWRRKRRNVAYGHSPVHCFSTVLSMDYAKRLWVWWITALHNRKQHEVYPKNKSLLSTYSSHTLSICNKIWLLSVWKNHLTFYSSRS